MQMPSTASEVLRTASPVAGDPREAFAAAHRLAETLVRTELYRSDTEASRTALTANRSDATALLDSELATSAVQQAVLLLADLHIGQRAFQGYGARIDEIHAEARTLRSRAEESLSKIRACVSQLEQIAQLIGVQPQSAWRSRVTLAMPEPSTVQSADPVENEAQLRAVRDRHERDWRLTALRLNAALDDLEGLQAAWRALYQRRVDCERSFAQSLYSTRLGEQLRFRRGVEREYSDAVTAAYVTRKPLVGDGPGTRRDHPLLHGLYRNQLGTVLLGRQISAEAVAKWWDGLSAQERRTLMNEVPLVVGNLDGVPITDRVAANAISAKAFAEAEGISAEEARYWRRAANGAVTLVVSDPERSRLVEMIGDIGPGTQRVITYVPGTGALPKSFYAGEAQAVSDYLVKRSSGSAVAFVYKDGPWVSWAGSNSNTNYEFLGGLGERVAGFQTQVLDREPQLSGAARVQIAHSAGMSVGTAAEQAGAEFDLVISLGGSFTMKEWQPSPGTEYHHFQYDNDAINRIDGGRLRTPHELTEVFTPHVYDSEGRSEAQSHSRIAQGPEANEEALREMRRVIQELHQ